MRFIHLTDPHLSVPPPIPWWPPRLKRRLGYLSWQRKRRFVHRTEVLAKLTDAILKEDADQILLTGDLVQIGTPEEIDAAADWLRRLGSPDRVLLTLGNHDVYASNSWPAIRNAWGEYLTCDSQTGNDPRQGEPRVRKLGHMRFVALCSAIPTPILSARGALGDRQLAALRGLADDPKRLTCVAVHHPPLPGLTHWRKALAATKQMRRALECASAGIVLHGHCHENTLTVDGSLHVFGTASASADDVRPGRQASYRCFDVATSPHGLQVTMSLKTLQSDGSVSPVQTQTLNFPRATTV